MELPCGIDTRNKMQTSPEIEHVIENAVKIAKEKQHEYVLAEHLLLALLQHEPFATVIQKFGGDLENLCDEVDSYLNSLKHITTKDTNVQPKKTNGLERLFNRALTQVLFTGRRTITTIDLYLSMMTETNSHAHYFLLKYGITKQEFVRFWEKNYKHNDVTITRQQASEVLDEYCLNALYRCGFFL